MDEDLRFENERGQTLAASVHRPRRSNGRGAIVCHGMLSSRSSPKHVGLCRELSRRGIIAMRFDFAGRGESDGVTEEMTYERQVEDLSAAVRRLRLETDRIALAGSSMGAAVALLYAARDHQIRCVVGIASVGRPGKVLEAVVGERPAWERWRRDGVIDLAGHRVRWGLARSAASTDVLAATKALRVPLLLLHGEHDEVVPLAQAEELAATAEISELEVISGGDHLLHRPRDQTILEKRAGDFVSLHLA